MRNLTNNFILNRMLDTIDLSLLPKKDHYKLFYFMRQIKFNSNFNKNIKYIFFMKRDIRNRQISTKVLFRFLILKKYQNIFLMDIQYFDFINSINVLGS